VSLWIFDTDHLSLLQRGNLKIVQRITAVSPQEIAVTVVTMEEQLQGRLSEIRRASRLFNADKLISAYAYLQETLDDFKELNVLQFDQTAYTYYTQLQSQKVRIGTQDLRIASIALSVNGTLLTRNQRDFCQVPSLKFEDWTL
jgi:tRNA(fMet)-specific endonuclease VapC